MFIPNPAVERSGGGEWPLQPVANERLLWRRMAVGVSFGQARSPQRQGPLFKRARRAGRGFALCRSLSLPGLLAYLQALPTPPPRLSPGPRREGSRGPGWGPLRGDPHPPPPPAVREGEGMQREAQTRALRASGRGWCRPCIRSEAPAWPPWPTRSPPRAGPVLREPPWPQVPGLETAGLTPPAAVQSLHATERRERLAPHLAAQNSVSPPFFPSAESRALSGKLWMKAAKNTWMRACVQGGPGPGCGVLGSQGPSARRLLVWSLKA